MSIQRGLQEQANKLSLVETALFVIMFVSLSFSLLTSNDMIMLVFSAAWVVLLFTPQRYLTVPALAVFCNILTIPVVGGAFYKPAIILLLCIDAIMKKRILLDKARAIEGIVCVLFLIAVLTQYKGFSVLSYIPVLLYFMLLWRELEDNRSKCRLFYAMYVISMMISILVGFMKGTITTETALIGSSNMELSRFYATFVDPNYAGLFINAAICMCIGVNLFHRLIRIPVLILLYAALFMTSSMTALLCNVIIIGYIALHKYGFKLKYVLPSMAVLMIVVFVFASGIYTRISMINTVITRAGLKLNALLEDNDVRAFTSGRTGLTELHWNYLISKASIWNWLFGGIPSTALYCLNELGGQMAHLEYLDLILNIGVIGATTYLGSILYRFITSLKKNKIDKTESNITRCALFINYLLGGLSLSLFMEPQFFLWVVM